MLAFCILGFLVLAPAIYICVYIGECIFDGFKTLYEVGGDYLDRRTIGTRKQS